MVDLKNFGSYTGLKVKFHLLFTIRLFVAVAATMNEIDSAKYYLHCACFILYSCQELKMPSPQISSEKALSAKQKMVQW